MLELCIDYNHHDLLLHFAAQIHDVMLSVLTTISGTDNNIAPANMNNVETKFRLKDHFFNTSLYHDNSDAVLNGLQFQNSQGPNSNRCSTKF